MYACASPACPETSRPLYIYVYIYWGAEVWGYAV